MQMRASPSAISKPRARHAAIIAFYALATVLVLNRLILGLSSYVSQGPLNDYHEFIWNNWWIGYALGTLHADPYFTNYVLYPFTHNLGLHALTPILFPPYALLEPLLGQIAAMNVILWASFTLNGYLTYLFLKRWTKSTLMALLGGLLFAFSPAMMDHAVNYHANMWLLWWFPALLLLWEAVANERRLSRAVLLAVLFGIALWGLWMTDMQFLVWTPCLLVPFGLSTLLRDRWRAPTLIALGATAILVMTALCCIAPFPALLQGDPGGATSPASVETARAYSLPLSALLLMPGEADRSIGRIIVLLTALAFFVRPQRPMRWFWFGVAALCLTLALGPDTQIGNLTIPLPYAILHPLLQGLYRFPSRFASPGILALLVFIGMSFRIRWRRLIACVGVLAIFLDGNLLAPFPVQEPLKDLPIYHQIGAEPDDYVVLHVPVTVHSGWAQVGGSQGQRAQYLQLWTHKKQLNGALSRIPDSEHVFYEEPPLMSFLSGTNVFVAPRPFDPQAASRELSRLIGAWPIGYVLVHTTWLAPEKALQIIQFMNAQPDLCFVSQEDDVLAYRARARGCPDLAAPNGLRIAFGQVGDDQYLLENWYVRENVGGVAARWMHDTARLTIPVERGQRYQLRLKALGYGPDRQVTILANSQFIERVRLPEDWTEHTLDIPAQVIGAAHTLTLTLQANGSLSPAQQAGSGDQRLLSAALSSLELIPVQE